MTQGREDSQLKVQRQARYPCGLLEGIPTGECRDSIWNMLFGVIPSEEPGSRGHLLAGSLQSSVEGCSWRAFILRNF